MSLLRLRTLTASYGAGLALDGVDLDLAEGEVLALMGRNGMGKSTTIKAICRMVSTTGQISFSGHDLTRLPSDRVARLGIGLVPEGRRCFRDLTVTENLVAAARPGPWDRTRVITLFPRLGERLTQRASTLSGGEQQMLAIGRALMTNPRLLLLDEATEGLAPLLRQEIWDAVTDMKTRFGLSILLVDKSLRELRSIADSAVVLEKGRTVWAGGMSQLTDDICERYVGI